ncbi:9007_t:CDS:2 [Entrophospora sp. SA101]|nr:9007_t:CDS:2 [Entrophospora sp. SA101]
MLIPIREVTKRAPGDEVGKFTQCTGTYPITFTEVSYTPAIWEPDEPCPVQPGHFDKTHEWKVEESPFQPKDMTVDYFVNSTVVSKDQTVLACLEGTVSIKYP